MKDLANESALQILVSKLENESPSIKAVIDKVIVSEAKKGLAACNIQTLQFLAKTISENKILQLKGTRQFFRPHVSNSGDLIVSPIGGGYLLRNNAIEPKDFEVIDEIPTEYVKCVVTLEEDPNFTFEAYVNPNIRWNGWVIPYFELDVAKKVIEAVKADESLSEYCQPTRNDEKGHIAIYQPEWEDTTYEEDRVINVDDKVITVVSFMGANWTWDAHHGDKAKKLLAQATYLN